ncbi:hypothetical protein K470DRAFT_280951 [Piedraia hortae CBS 480.64]|uniref:Ubiquitin carboxyl-terminal hydrolase 19 n=1 Tax=Piedraia hortae CBS 480.64 TaxID=1314780 RepID=A0A6A7C4V1_9PEZI|nr:hypothetical protein K470DRAFT_280951 [Piedraia hortae CBS 480.64]
MDPSSQAFVPSTNGTWRLQAEVTKLHQLQAELADRLARVEKKQEESQQSRGIWGPSASNPQAMCGVLQHGPMQHPDLAQFDQETRQLHLETDDEPRSRGITATSRANSVRFDESANQNHFSHSTRASVDLISRANSTLNGLSMADRTLSYKSDGRTSSAHSMRSGMSGRVSSLQLDTTYGLGDACRSPVSTPALAPGLLLLGAMPAIIRCWLTRNFKHDQLLYAAVCTGSYKSFLDWRLVQKLGFEHAVKMNGAGERKVEVRVYLPEAVPHPASTRSSSPAPHVPSVTTDFYIVEQAAADPESKAVQIVIGSDTLRIHNADILFSSSSMSLFDDERNKLNIPLVRPEDEAVFNSLSTMSDQSQTVIQDPQPMARPYLNGLGQHSSALSTTSSSASLPSDGQTRATGPHFTTMDAADAAKIGVIGDEVDARPESRISKTSRHPLPTAQMEPAPQSASHRPESSSIWNNWRRDGTNMVDWASVGKSRENPQPRGERAIKILKPKSGNRATSASISNGGGPSDGRSRYFDEGKWREPQGRAKAGDGINTGAATSKTKSNPIGSATAFPWLNSGGSK